ncbi:MAG TPA: copper resistance protein NlpE [candidate division Zixibacteria bacterium]|nr:copper resistance protein NlpE [candidate division Zixibacteria bacterium]
MQRGGILESNVLTGYIACMKDVLVKYRYMLFLCLAIPVCVGCGERRLQAGFRTPATFSGTIPCADCPGIKFSLTLRPDSLFYATDVYIEGKDPEHSSFTWWGHWTFDPSGKRISPLSGDHPQFLKLVDSTRVRMLDGDGNEIPTGLNYDLTRAPEVDTLPDTVKSTGLFR